MEPRNQFRGIDFASLVPWRAGTKNRVVVPARQAGNRFLVSLKGLQIPAQYTVPYKLSATILTTKADSYRVGPEQHPAQLR
jgi:hypothetical protein